MQRYINRQATDELKQSLSHNPVTALIGPRQCGKSTLARHVLQTRKDALILDLELPSDMRKLGDPGRAGVLNSSLQSFPGGSHFFIEPRREKRLTLS